MQFIGDMLDWSCLALGLLLFTICHHFLPRNIIGNSFVFLLIKLSYRPVQLSKNENKSKHYYILMILSGGK